MAKKNTTEMPKNITRDPACSIRPWCPSFRAISPAITKIEGVGYMKPFFRIFTRGTAPCLSAAPLGLRSRRSLRVAPQRLWASARFVRSG